MELALFAVAVLAVVVAVLARAHAPVGDAALRAWAHAHGLRLTAENRDLVRRQALRACGDVGHRAWRVRRAREPGTTPA